MSQPPRLTTTSYVILGHLALRDPALDPALDSWGDPAHYDRNDPFPLFARVRAAGAPDGPRRGDRLGRQGRRRGQDRGDGGGWNKGQPEPI